MDNQHLKTGIVFDEQFFRSAEVSAQIGAWVLDVESQQTYLTDGAYLIFGAVKKIPTTLEIGLTFFPKSEVPIIKKLVDESIAYSQRFQHDCEFLPWGTDTYKWVRITGYPDKTEDGKVVRLSGTIQDITALKNAEQKLRNQKDQIDLMLEETPAMVYQFEIQPDGRLCFPFISRKAFEIYEIDKDSFNGDGAELIDNIHEEDQRSLFSSIEKSKADLSSFEWSGRIITKNSGIKWIMARSVPRKTEGESILWNGILIDITEERQRQQESKLQQEKMFHQSKLASIGELAAGLGHEVNNPLAITLGNLKKLKRMVKSRSEMNEEFKTCFDNIDRSAKRIVNVISGLNDVSRVDSMEQVPLNLVDAVKQDIALVEEVFRQQGVLIRAQYEHDEVFVLGSKGRLQQVGLNLLSNARDAVEFSKEKIIDIRLYTDGDDVCVSVKDSGTGVDPAVRDRIFQSFVTTKPSGKGTGLGLSLSERIVEDHKGQLSFETEVGKGTTFTVSFPLYYRENVSQIEDTKRFTEPLSEQLK